MNPRTIILWSILVLLQFAAGRGEIVSIWFAPEDDCEAAIVEQFAAAKKSLHYQLYNFTSQPVADALIAAQERGVEVVILLDHTASLSPHCQAKRCHDAGCQVYLDSKHPISHNKIRIIDGKHTLGGSFNDSAQAKHNAENLTLDDDKSIAAKFEANFQAHLEHSIEYSKSVRADKKKAAAK